MLFCRGLKCLLLKGKGGGPKQRRILELNPNHEIFIRVHERFKKEDENSELATYAELRLGYALLAEGSEIPDVVKFNQRVIDLML